tara:strand:- start:5302 stop:7041 length:1740 start_codon:yes stop_codon:yes gene_type:complete
MKIDLYNLFQSNGLSLPVSSGFTEIGIFKAFIRIILACDAVHDFLGDRAFMKPPHPDQKKFFLKTTMYYLIRDLNAINPGMTTECNRLLNSSKLLNSSSVFARQDRRLRYDNPEAADSFIRGDASAKEVVGAILTIMGLQKISLSALSEGECDGSPSFFRMLDILTRVQENIKRQQVTNPSYNIKIDATSNPMNLLPIYSGVLENYRKFKSECPNIPTIKLIEDLSTSYDPSNVDQLSKFFNEQGLVLKSMESILNYDIRIGEDDQIIDCTLQSFAGDTVQLSIKKFFNETFSTPIIRSNDSVGRQKNNSVNTLALEMVTKYNTSTSADRANGGLVMQSFYGLSMFKTMGDFLQLMTFLCIETKCDQFRGLTPDLVNSISAFISFDIICYEMGSIFSRFVVGETSDKGSNALITGMSIYLREDMVAAVTLAGYSRKAFNINRKKRARREAEQAAVKSLMQLPISFSSPSLIETSPGSMDTSSFGKKSNKLNSMSNEELKRKLHSVGINVTKLSSKGKRLPLTRKEMEKKAMAFKNLQLRAKKYKIKLMYKSKRRGYVYKSYARLMNDINRKLGKNKFGA